MRCGSRPNSSDYTHHHLAMHCNSRHSPTYSRLFASFHNIVFEVVLLVRHSGAKGVGRVCVGKDCVWGIRVVLLHFTLHYSLKKLLSSPILQQKPLPFSIFLKKISPILQYIIKIWGGSRPNSSVYTHHHSAMHGNILFPA